MDNYIIIDKKIYLQEYKYNDKEKFMEVYIESNEENYKALLEIWSRGINVYLINKKRMLSSPLNIGFLSIIDYTKLSNNERAKIQLFGVPKRFNGMFINDMRLSVPYRYKGIGTKVIKNILSKKNIYALDPIEDGKYFWKKFGFEYNKIGKLAILDNR